jgi:dethiobiotin synthetase
MKAFVTGSGTDIGKTWFCARWVEALRAAGRSPVALKPVLSGLDAAPLADSDAGRLVSAMGQTVSAASVARICPWQFGPPISPDMAATRAGTPLVLEDIVEFCRSVDAADVLVEGVGGVMVPLNDHHLVLDWLNQLAWPVVLVTGSYLGSLSHTLTAVRTLEAADCAPVAVVVSQSEHEPVPLAESVATLQRFCSMPVWPLPRDGSLSPEHWSALTSLCEE